MGIHMRACKDGFAGLHFTQVSCRILQDSFKTYILWAHSQWWKMGPVVIPFQMSNQTIFLYEDEESLQQQVPLASNITPLPVQLSVRYQLICYGARHQRHLLSGALWSIPVSPDLRSLQAVSTDPAKQSYPEGAGSRKQELHPILSPSASEQPH